VLIKWLAENWCLDELFKFYASRGFCDLNAPERE